MRKTERPWPCSRSPGVIKQRHGTREVQEKVRIARQDHTPSELATELEALQALSRQELGERWEELYERPCPRSMSRLLLLRAVAYRIQERVLGGLDRTTRRRLERAEANLQAGKPLASPTPRIKPGTRLLREWQGVLHEVTVLEKGVEYRSDTWPSLSAVAREITGTHWSGPRFFGLKGQPRAGQL